MVLNDKALHKKWSSKHDKEDVNTWHWRIKILPKHIIKAFEHVADTTNANTAALLTEWLDKATISRWKRAIETDGDNEWRQDKNTYPKVTAAARRKKERRTPTNNERCHTSSAPADVSDSDSNEVQVISLWNKEARKEDVYKIAYCIFLGRSLGLLPCLECRIGWRSS
jgi:hypothetical protein